MKISVVLLLVLTCLICFSGCSNRAANNPEPVSLEPAYYIHTIRHPGENLWIIAKWYTGEGARWEDLTVANPALNPNNLQIGDGVKIPEEILVKSENLPRTVVMAALRAQQNQVKQMATTDGVEEEVKDKNPSSNSEGDSTVAAKSTVKDDLNTDSKLDQVVEETTIDSGDDTVRAQLWAELSQ